MPKIPVLDPNTENTKLFWKRLEELDPLLYQLRVFLDEFHFHPEILPRILRHLVLVDKGTGYHDIVIHIKEHRITTINGADTDRLDLPIRLEE